MKVQWTAAVEVCFPAIIVTGLPHSGSTFVHQLMSSLPGKLLILPSVIIISLHINIFKMMCQKDFLSANQKTFSTFLYHIVEFT